MSAGPDPRAFVLDGGDTGVLMLHGFTGSPPELRRVADFLHARGLTVHAPLLAGHGTRWQDLNQVRWQEWSRQVAEAHDVLAKRCPRVVLAGFSMGSLLAAHQAVQGGPVAGVVLYAPAFWSRDRLVPLSGLGSRVLAAMPKKTPVYADSRAAEWIGSYDCYPLAGVWEFSKLQRLARRDLPLLRVPLLVVSSGMDRSIHPAAAARTLALAGSSRKESLFVANSSHCVCADAEWETVARRSWAFIEGLE